MQSPFAVGNTGLIPFQYQGETLQTYYNVFGSLENRTRPPVVAIHGGPGMTHDYILPLADLSTKHGFPVIFYDQVGNGRASHLPQKPATFWSVELWAAELANVLAHFGIADAYHIVGHSWGGMLASEFVVRGHAAPGLQRLVLTNAPAEVKLWNESFQTLLSTFPKEVRDGIAGGVEKDQKRFWDAMMAFYKVHGCNTPEFPDELVYTFNQVYGPGADRTVSNAQPVKGWSIVDRVGGVHVPTLVINGRDDIAQDYVVQAYVDGIAGARFVTFQNSSHCPFWEEREAYIDTLARFLGE